MSIIVCGYAGVGKSYLAKNYAGTMDLVSTPFEKDQERYVKCAIHYHKSGYLVLVSCHKELRERLYNYPELNKFDVMTIVPSIGSKEEYRERYTDRGRTEAFIKDGFPKMDGFLGGWARVELPNGKWTFVNDKGEFFGKEFKMVYGFINGISEVVCEDGTERYINTNGEFVEYDTEKELASDDYKPELGSFEVVKVEDGYKITTNKEVSPIFKAITPFSCGIASVTFLDGTHSYINKNGVLITKERFKYTNIFYEDGLASVQLLDGTWKILKANGEFLVTE